MLSFVKSLKTSSEVSLKKFMVPGEQAGGGDDWGIPQKLTIARDDDQSKPILRVPPAFEETYDLEKLRYPFKVQFMENLPAQMIKHLTEIIGKNSVSSDLRLHWNKWKSTATRRLFRNKYDILDLTKHSWLLVGIAFNIIHPDDACLLDFTETKDGRAKADIHMRMQSSGEIIILETVIDPKLGEEYTSNLVKLASGELQSSFEADLPDGFDGHEAILAKLSYEAMEDWGKGPRWAIIYGGNLYILYLVVPVVVGNTKRCLFISSGVLPIDSTEHPYLALKLYMMLSSRIPREDLMTLLGVQAPLGSTIQLSTELCGTSVGGDCAESKPFDPTSPDPSTEVLLDRLMNGEQSDVNDHGSHSELLKFLLQPLGTGSTSTIYRSGKAVFKVSGLKHEADIENEAREPYQDCLHLQCPSRATLHHKLDLAMSTIPAFPSNFEKAPAPWNLKAEAWWFMLSLYGKNEQELSPGWFAPLESNAAEIAHEPGAYRGGLSVASLIRYYESPVGP
ncbi:14144_t:CDS:2, partial [Acaulospora colombiana]